MLLTCYKTDIFEIQSFSLHSFYNIPFIFLPLLTRIIQLTGKNHVKAVGLIRTKTGCLIYSLFENIRNKPYFIFLPTPSCILVPAINFLMEINTRGWWKFQRIVRMDIIPCIKWVQRGIAKSIPDKVRFHYFSLENKLYFIGKKYMHIVQ